jgi:malate dehydrogenase (oxaloacetate-decarboxylating)(NADP+)
MSFGREYLIPKPFDPRVLTWEAPAVAKAAMECGVARRPIEDFDAYRESLERIMGPSRKVMHMVFHKAKKAVATTRRVVYPEGEEACIIRGARNVADQGIARPILLGNMEKIAAKAEELGIETSDFDIIDPKTAPKAAVYATDLYALRQRKGLTPGRSADLIQDPTLFGLMMVREGEADGFVGGMKTPYPETIRPALQIVGLQDGVSRISALHLLVLRDRLFFCADTMVNIEPSAEELAEIACLAADTALYFDVQPRVAMLAFSSFGSVRHAKAERVAAAVEIVQKRRPDLVIDGEMHVDTALSPELVKSNYPHSKIQGDANVLIFPDLNSGNIGYKLVQRLGRADVIGPILMGMRRPVNVLQHGSTVAEVVNTTAITVVAAEMLTPHGAATVPALPASLLRGLAGV